MKKRFIIVHKDCPGCQEIKKNIKPEGFEYVDLSDKNAEDILLKIDNIDFNRITVPMAVECDDKKCKICEIKITDKGIEFKC